MPVTFFPVTSPVSKTFAYLACVLRAHYAICRYMFTVGFQYNFRLVSDMLLFWCSWFKYRFIKLDLVTVGKFCFHFSRVLGSVVDRVKVNPSARVALKPCVMRRKCALTKVGTVLKSTWMLMYSLLKYNFTWTLGPFSVLPCQSTKGRRGPYLDRHTTFPFIKSLRDG